MMLQRELGVKNEQIDELTTALSETSKALHAAQALHAGTMQKQLLTDGLDKERRGFFSRLFKKD